MKQLAWAGIVLFISACASSNAQDGIDAAQGPDTAVNADASGAGFGEPCTMLSDCSSGLCYQPSPPDAGECTVECDGNCPPGYECRVVMIADFTDLRVCVPASETMCSSCDTNDDCGDSSDLCVQFTDGYACSIDCAGDPTVCPEGFTCQVVFGAGDTQGMQCMPLNGLCCVDNDGDLHGSGSQCFGADCDDTDEDIYDDADEVCDGKDNDCVGGIDNDPIDCDPPSCDLGAGAYFEQAREQCNGTDCVDETPVTCGLYTCAGGGELGDECADTCDVEADGKCVDSAHCDASACLDDLLNGQACDELTDCESGYCGNDFCCPGGDCCSVASDCPTFGTIAPICDNASLCQGTRGEAVCNGNFQCQSNGVEQDDSACDATTLADDCDYYLSIYCNGNVTQSAPACPTTCTSDTECDPDGFCRETGPRACVEDHEDGEQCNDDDECKSDHCANGYCCAAGECCSRPEDCPGAFSDPPNCDSQATCQGTRDDASCVDSMCGTVSNVADDSDCSGVANDCGSYIPTLCNGGPNQTPPNCLGMCTSNADCDASAYCRADGQCVPDEPDGGICANNTQCGGGYCNNGHCCSGGTCCNTSSDCDLMDVAATCTSASGCQGSRVDGVCTAAKQCTTQTVDDDSACTAGTLSNTCGAYPSVFCNGMTTQSTPGCASTCGAGTPCDTGNYCDGASHCQSTGDPGASCTTPNMCTSNICTDDVCCNSSCTGLCRACDITGTSGTCTMVANGTDWDGECGAIDCDSYFNGWNGDRCFTKADVPASQSDCNGSGGCETAAQACPGQGAGVVQIDCNDTCQATIAGTCTGTTAGQCQNLNLGNNTCGIGECTRTMAVCNNGQPQNCVPGNPTTEVCDLQDDDCNGIPDDDLWNDTIVGYELNDAAYGPTVATHQVTSDSGTISGKILPDAPPYNDDEDWFAIYAEDRHNDPGCPVFDADDDLWGRVRITVPAGVTYTVCGCWSINGLCDGAAATCQSASGGTSAWISTRKRVTSCSSSDPSWFDVQVYSSGTNRSCSNYTVEWAIWESE